jgi:hypothetical protein
VVGLLSDPVLTTLVVIVVISVPVQGLVTVDVGVSTITIGDVMVLPAESVVVTLPSVV